MTHPRWRVPMIAAVVAALAAVPAHPAPVPPSGGDKPAPSLEMVPPDGGAFVHIRIFDLWQSQFGQQTLAAFRRLDPKFETEAEKKLGMPLNNLDTGTMIVPSF